MRKGILIAGVTLLLLSPLNVYAHGEWKDNIESIVIKETNYTDANLLNGGGYYLMTSKYTIKDAELSKPEGWVVKRALTTMFLKMEKYGVNTQSLAEKRLTYEIINVDMENIAGHAFVVHPNPTIYLYGKYDYQLSEYNVGVTTVHEFAHFVEKNVLNSQDRQQYREIRKIPNNLNNQQELEWGQRFEEIFADDFTKIFYGLKFHRLAVPEINEEEIKDVRDLIIEAIKRETTARVYTDDRNRFIIEKLDLQEQGILPYGESMEKYLNNNLTTEYMIKWFTSDIIIKDEDFSKYLKVIDLERIFKGYRVGNHSTSGLNKNDIKNMIEMIENLLEKDILIDRTIYWGSKYDKNKVTKEIDKAKMMFKERNIITADKLTKGDKPITRQEAVHLLYKSLELNVKETNVENNKFIDVPANHPYSAEINLLVKHGVITGKTQEEFGWGEYLTREQMVGILNRAYNFNKLNNNKEITFKDKETISKIFLKDVEALYSNEVIHGNVNNTFKPKEKVTYNQLLLMLYRTYLNKVTVLELDNSRHDTYHTLKTLKQTLKEHEFKNEIITNHDLVGILMEVNK